MRGQPAPRWTLWLRRGSSAEPVVRGEVLRLRAPRGARRAEQRGERFAVIVQADELLALSTVLASPTSLSAPPRSFRRELDDAFRLVFGL